jgi:hypothetical protein
MIERATTTTTIDWNTEQASNGVLNRLPIDGK